jgi:CRP-like cAMP-binding protein
MGQEEKMIGKSAASVVPVVVNADCTDLEPGTSIDARPLLSRDLLAGSPLFEGVTAAQMVELSSICRERRFAVGELILSEGAQEPFVYVLIEGIAQVIKNTSVGSYPVPIARLGAGDVLGELKIVEPRPSSASVTAVTEVTAVEININSLAESAPLTAVRATLLTNAGRILAARLISTTGKGADAIQRELDETRARMHAGRFIVLMFAMVATYQLAIAALVLVPGSARPATSVLSVIFVIWAVVPVVLLLRSSPFPLASYGLTTQGGGRIALQALIWTTPLLPVVLAFKLMLTRWVFPMADQSLFDPAALFAGHPFDLSLYLFAICLYLIHAPAQELVARAGLQGALQNFIPTQPGKINWKAIIISNLMFAAAHSFIGFWFCVAAFVPGLFWGWMFAKQRSLIGVAVSHAVVGLWAIFVVGVRAIIGG